MTNLDSILKSRDVTLSTKVSLVRAMVFPVVMYEEIFERPWEGVETDPFTTWGFAVMSFPIYTWVSHNCGWIPPKYHKLSF